MKGYLKIPGHSYSLDADVISIGKGCDNRLIPPEKFRNAGAHIPISTGKADPYHAVVEKHPDEKCFYLSDLNTAYGTYVNKQKIQNAKVKLSPGDQIRFGHGGILHEFGICREDKNKYRQSNPSSARIESGSIDELRSNGRFSPQSNGSSLFILSNITRPDTAPSFQQSTNSNMLKLIFEDRAKSVPMNMKMADRKYQDEAKTISTDRQTNASSIPTGTHDGWSLDGQDVNDFCDRETTFSKASSVEKENYPIEPWYVSMLREKEQRLLHMGDEISRLTRTENESRKKDDMILELRSKIAEMDIATVDFSNNVNATEKTNQLLQMGDEINRLTVYKQECERKDLLLESLQEQIGRLELEREELSRNIALTSQNRTVTPLSQGTADEWKSTLGNPSSFVEQFQDDLTDINVSLQQNRDELDEFREQLNLPIPDRRDPQEIIMELFADLEQKQDIITQLTGDLKEAKHEKNLSDGLTNSLQRDIDRGERTVTQLMTALEKAQKETKEAVNKAKAMSNKFATLKEEIKHEEILASMEQKFCDTQERLKDFQMQLSKQQQKYDKQSKDLRRANRQTKQHLEKGRVLQSQVEELQTEIYDLKQKEQSSRVQSEQTTSRLERLRSKIVQAVYIAPGAIKPETKLEDGEILSAIQKLINDRSEFHQQLCDLGQPMPPLVTVLETPSEDSSDVEVASNTTEKKNQKGQRKSGKK